MLIETCPKCGGDLMNEVICTNPPIPKKFCLNCGWSWEGTPEKIVREPFTTKHMLNKEELNTEILFWHPELEFAKSNGIGLVLEIDAFNSHMIWNVKWRQSGYDCYREFEDFASARDYFLEKAEEFNEDKN